MTDATRYPIMTAERAYHVSACSDWIDARLRASDAGMLRCYVAQNALAVLSQIGLADVTSTPEELRVTIYGITATTRASAAGVLREWQARAKDRLAAGWQP